MDEKSTNIQRDSLKEILSPTPKMIVRIKKYFSLMIRNLWPKDSATSSQILLEEGYKNFNILIVDGKFYAIHQKEGAFSVRKFEQKKYKLCFSGDTINELKLFIDKHPLEPIPILVGSWKRFNIVSYGDKYYGLSWDEGKFDINRFNSGNYRYCVEGKTVDEVKSLIDNLLL